MSSPATIAEAAERLGPLASANVGLGPFSTYRVGGPAALFVTVDTAADLDVLAQTVAATAIDVLVVGNGSNLLVSDSGFAGIALRLGEAFAAIEIDGTSVRAGGAALLPVVARRCVAAGLTGFEWAVGVPGSMGGAVRMNAGGHGSDMAATVVGVRVLDLRTGDHGVVSTADLAFEYRRSAISAHQLVTEVELALTPLDAPRGADAPAVGDALLSEIVRWRREHQPGGQNAGSVFTNPAGDSAGRLIDAAGLRGRRYGSAEVSTKHANFIQADPGGRANDVFALMAEVQAVVQAHAGVHLHPETVCVGFASAGAA